MSKFLAPFCLLAFAASPGFASTVPFSALDHERRAISGHESVLAAKVLQSSATGAIVEVIAGGRSYRLKHRRAWESRVITVDLDRKVSKSSGNFRYPDSPGGFPKNGGFVVDDRELASVPLPASLSFLLAGLGGLAGLRGRHR